MTIEDIPLQEVGTTIQMTGSVYADKDHTYLVMLPGEEPHERPSTVLLTMEEWQTFLRQTDLVEVKALVKDPDSQKMVKATLRKSERQISQKVSWAVFRRDGFQCRYCGTTSEPLTVDHLVTWEAGGPSTEANLVASCRKCNSSRGDMPFEDWLLSSFYKKASRGLDHSVKFQNQALAPTLSNIPLVIRKPKKRK